MFEIVCCVFEVHTVADRCCFFMSDSLFQSRSFVCRDSMEMVTTSVPTVAPASCLIVMCTRRCARQIRHLWGCYKLVIAGLRHPDPLQPCPDVSRTVDGHAACLLDPLLPTTVSQMVVHAAHYALCCHLITCLGHAPS